MYVYTKEQRMSQRKYFGFRKEKDCGESLTSGTRNLSYISY
jgi:hypothetical protein